MTSGRTQAHVVDAVPRKERTIAGKSPSIGGVCWPFATNAASLDMVVDVLLMRVPFLRRGLVLQFGGQALDQLPFQDLFPKRKALAFPPGADLSVSR